MVSQAALPGRRAARPPSRAHLALDAGIALVAFALSLALLSTDVHAGHALDVGGVVLAALASLPLVARRRWPLGVLAATTAASATLNAFDYALGPPIGATIALFFVAADERTRTRIRQAAAVVLGLFALHVGSTTIPHPDLPTSPILFGIVVWGGAFAAGDQVRQRRRRVADLEERARRAERDTARERRLAAAEERTRIARDLHDSAAHAINVILVQAGAARLLQDGDPEAVRTSLTTIEQVARETIGEIDQLIRGLREDDGTDGTHDAIEPPTGLAALDTLAERHRAAGLSVDLGVKGGGPLARGLDQAAYRILQESLTNAARHGSGRATVDLSYGERQLDLTVSNPLPPAAVNGSVEGGHGILGMRERAGLLGGSLEAGRGDGVFVVRARLPYVATGAGA